ncbi:MAG: hypothetical protein LWX56_01525 [Ignavibacteria bacterium]|nr:hypothetical protein [Ignavibacteria bacterium]
MFTGDVSVIDIGSNTVHQVIHTVTAQSLLIKHHDRRVHRLLRFTSLPYYIEDSEIVSLIQHLSEILSCSGDIPHIAIGTAALREAENSSEVCTRVINNTGLSIRILSSSAEAAYTYSAVQFLHKIPDAKLAVLDIGGGSSEIIIGNGINYTNCISLPLGTVRLTQAFFDEEPLNPASFAKAAQVISSVLLNSPLQKSDFEFAVCYGTSGIFRHLVNILNNPNDIITQADLINIFNHLQQSGTRSAIADKFSVDLSTAEILPAGVLILLVISEIYNIDSYIFSRFGLREGITLDWLRNS